MEETTKKRVAILGSTGSIGTQTLDVIRENQDKFEVEVITAHQNVDLLIKQALEFKPNAVVIADETKYNFLKEALSSTFTKVFAGNDALSQVMEMDTIDIVVAAMVGYSGLKPTLKAIENGKPIALANKETLVVAGKLVTDLAKNKAVNIFPVDSEHSAIFQCLAGEFHNKIEKIYLTASGGPFRGKTKEYLQNVTKVEALKHPNWTMGNKVTIDSATLMNKGLEVIEARWLFNLEPSQIDVVVHPQSIIHSIVQFEDGSMKAQMGLPDMKLPIQYAIAYPNRIKSSFPRFNFMDYPQLTFEKADKSVFRNLDFAYYAMSKCGNMPCILNAANEIAVEAFLNDKLGFLQISDIIEKSLTSVSYLKNPTYDDLVNTDIETRAFAKTLIK